MVPRKPQNEKPQNDNRQHPRLLTLGDALEDIAQQLSPEAAERVEQGFKELFVHKKNDLLRYGRLADQDLADRFTHLYLPPLLFPSSMEEEFASYCNDLAAIARLDTAGTLYPRDDRFRLPYGDERIRLVREHGAQFLKLWDHLSNAAGYPQIFVGDNNGKFSDEIPSVGSLAIREDNYASFFEPIHTTAIQEIRTPVEGRYSISYRSDFHESIQQGIFLEVLSFD
ncbi:hypothetical protein HZB02_01705 [Candidatus Woesearchaeota archaeon]|nr:hypothetical protein [Candidatus Woesearchaeota archaeon]